MKMLLKTRIKMCKRSKDYQISMLKKAKVKSKRIMLRSSRKAIKRMTVKRRYRRTKSKIIDLRRLADITRMKNQLK